MFLFNELIIYMKKGFLITCVIITCIATAIVLSNLTTLIVHEAETDLQEYNETYADGKYYGIGDKLMGDVEDVFVKQDNCIDILINMNNWLHNNKYFKYFEGRADQISYISNEIEGEFKDTYNDILNAFWLGPDDIEHFEIKTCEGSIFKETDFYHNKSLTNEPGRLCDGELPIVMGCRFRNKYEVGDTLDIYNFFYVGKAKIIGFLEANSKTVDSNGNIYVLDDSVILPFFTDFSGEESSIYMRCLFLQKNNGKLYSKLTAEDLQDMVNEYMSYLGITGAYFVFGAKNQWQVVFATNLDNMINDIGKIAIGITAFSSITLAIFLFVKIKKSERYFGIMAINGFNKNQIRYLVLLEVLMIITMSLVLGIAITGLIHDISYQEYDVNYLKGLFPLVITGIAGFVIGEFNIENQELSSLISRKE
ncbi:MAG: hypothetical protein K6E47_13995 [Lachnospiraceae bacterium]|nr:hypothetical protein [Lachnospiraceae bacterium]